ncbi:MAG: winged helix-turn-helix domain-containing protein [Mangrovibacterium sp.]
MKDLFKQLDKAFENKIRLGIMSALMVNRQVAFNDLKEMLELTDGNLASHLRYLEKENYISVEKSFINRKPNTVYAATQTGKAAFEAHLNALEEIIKQL